MVDLGEQGTGPAFSDPCLRCGHRAYCHAPDGHCVPENVACREGCPYCVMNDTVGASSSSEKRPNEERITRENLVSHIGGPDRWWRLNAWVAATAAALGVEVAILVGSALRSKGWRDIDVWFTFSDARWQEVYRAYSGDAWFALCGGLSAHATAAVGVPVDVQITRRGDGYVLWEASRG